MLFSDLIPHVDIMPSAKAGGFLFWRFLMTNLKDYDILLSRLPKEDAERTMNAIIKNYVAEVHKRAISTIHSKSGKTYYRTEVYQNGKRKQLSGTTIEVLYKKLYEFYTSDKEVTVDTCFKSVIESLRNKGRSENTIGTNGTYLKIYSRFSYDGFGNKAIDELSSDDINKHLLKVSKELHPTRCDFKVYKSILNQVFAYAYDKDIIQKNPMLSVQPTDFYRYCDFARKTDDEKYFTPEEINHIQSYYRNKIVKYQPYDYGVLFSILTGVRVGELCVIKWDDISDGAVHIHQQAIFDRNMPNKYKVVEWTKAEKGVSRGGRYFPLYEPLKQLIREIKEAQLKLIGDTEYVFCSTTSTKIGEFIRPDTYERYLTRNLSELGYKVTGNHAMRRSLNVNVLIPSGMPVQQRAKILGHSPITNMRFYSPVQTYELTSITNIINNYIGA